MRGRINGKTKVPSQRDIKLSALVQKLGDRTHKMDKDKYCDGKIKLMSKDSETLHEAILVTENFLSYNGSWDIERHRYEKADSYICELCFKWNGYLSIMDIIQKKLRLPEGVSKEIHTI